MDPGCDPRAGFSRMIIIDTVNIIGVLSNPVPSYMYAVV